MRLLCRNFSKSSRSRSNTAISRFSRLVPGADVATVYYSGHGMQFAGKNYLLPIDANLESAADVNRFQLMPVDDLIDVLTPVQTRMEALEAENRVLREQLSGRLVSAPAKVPV